jgi:hypothetical protein
LPAARVTVLVIINKKTVSFGNEYIFYCIIVIKLHRKRQTSRLTFPEGLKVKVIFTEVFENQLQLQAVQRGSWPFIKTELYRKLELGGKVALIIIETIITNKQYINMYINYILALEEN